MGTSVAFSNTVLNEKQGRNFGRLSVSNSSNPKHLRPNVGVIVWLPGLVATDNTLVC